MSRRGRASEPSDRAAVFAVIESANDWWALGVQWNPTSSTSSGLDIQLFRG